MPDNTVTLVLDGDVPLVTFAKAVAQFNKLIRALSDESGDPSLEWVIQDLNVSSAMASVASYGPAELVERVVKGYAEVGASLEANTTIDHIDSVRKAAKSLVSINDGRTKTVRMETEFSESIVSLGKRRNGKLLQMPGPMQGPLVYKARPMLGAVRGRIQTLTNRGALRFTLYDLYYDKAVSCYFTEGNQEQIRGLWGKLATVQGLVSRDPASGRPFSVREASVTPIPETGSCFDYQEARGAAPSLSGMSPEEAIRRVRDAQ